MTTAISRRLAHAERKVLTGPGRHFFIVEGTGAPGEAERNAQRRAEAEAAGPTAVLHIIKVVFVDPVDVDGQALQ